MISVLAISILLLLVGQSTARVVKPAVKNEFIPEIPRFEARAEHSCNVLILGAGMAGVTAAKTLSDLGVTDIMIVEGDSRIGGRVKNEAFGGVNVELGANWVQYAMLGNKPNPLDALVEEAGLEFVEDDFEDYIFRYEGQDVTAEADDAFDKVEPALDKASELAQRKYENGEPDVNYRVALMLADWRPVTPVQSAAEFYDFDFEFSDEPSDTGLMDNYEVYSLPSDSDKFITDQRGYATIIENLASKIDLEGKLFLNEYVTEIHTEEHGHEHHMVKVVSHNSVTKAHTTYRANYVLVTFSLGVLQSDNVQFFPALPSWKEEMIYMFKMTSYVKIFVKFPDAITPFWDAEMYINYVDPTVRGRYQIWENMNALGGPFSGSNMLMVTVLGNNWDRVQHLSKNEVKAELFEVLKSMYGDAAVEPEDILIPDWDTNPLYLGAFSNWPIGVTDETYKNLAAPVDRLYMAGEACTYNAGYVHGAYESGEEVALKLYDCMINNVCEEVPPNGYGTGSSCDQARNGTNSA